MATLSFELVTPERTVLSEELVSLTCPTDQGYITILPGHVPLVATLIPGELEAKSSSDEFFINVAGGFVQVDRGSKVTVLADAAEHHHEIDLARAEAAKRRAEAAMREVRAGEGEYAKVAAALERSLSRLRVARKRASRRSFSVNQNNEVQ